MSSPPSAEPHAPETRLGLSDTTTPYLGGDPSHGSGTTGGPGHGDKTSSSSSSTASDATMADEVGATRLDSAHQTASYTGGARYGSGTTAGPGAGNKTSGSMEGSADSTMGKLMERAGGLLKKEGLAEKGHEKREAAGYDGGSG